MRLILHQEGPFGEMNQEKSIKLFLQGREAWNAWAERLLRRKRQLIKAGVWFTNREFDFEAGYYRTVGLNEATTNWLERAYVDFSCLRFIAGDETSNKSKARNGQEKKFINSRDIPLEGMNIDFRGFIFPGDLRFDHSELHGVSLFNGAEFYGTAWFSNTAFFSDCWFEEASFQGLACFHQAEFISFTTFALSRFEDNANFEAIRAGRSFDLSCCWFQNEVPDFIDAEFERPPRLAEITILPPPAPQRFSARSRAVIKQYKEAPRYLRQLMLADLMLTDWAKRRAAFTKGKFLNARRKRADEAHFNALRKIAIEAKDFASERKFHAGQVRARRHLADQMKDLPTGFLRYLYGAMNELTTNFGRSLWRPALAWGFVFYLFTGIYWMTAPASKLAACQNTPAISPYEAAETIAARNAFLTFGESAEVDVRRAKHCLAMKAEPEKKYQRLASLPKKPQKDQTRLAALDEGQNTPAVKIAPPLKDVIVASSENQLDGPVRETDTAMEAAYDLAADDITGSLPREQSRFSRTGLLQMLLHLIMIGLFLNVLRNQLRLR